MASSTVLVGASIKPPNDAHYQKQHKHHQRQKEQGGQYVGGRAAYAAEAQDACDNGADQK